MPTGQCLCGSVTYSISGSFKGAGNCHCSNCRRAHGAAYASWAFIEPGQFQWESGENNVASFASSAGLERLFCRVCGSPLAARHDDSITEVVLASVDGDPGVRPSEHIFVGSKAPWHEVTDTLVKHDQWPPGMKT